MKLLIIAITLEIAVLRIFWAGALKRIDKRVDQLMQEYADALNDHLHQ